MRRFATNLLAVLLVGVLFGDAGSNAWSQSSRTAPLPLKSVARTRLFQKQQKDEPQTQTPSTIPADPSIPPTPPGQLQAPANPQAANPQDKVLIQVKNAIEINKRRYLNPTIGHSPWMIMHGALALRQDYQLMVGNKPVNAIEYISQQNPKYANEPWFEATAYGGRAHPYLKPYYFEGHVNQFLAILSMSDLPLTQQFKVRDPQMPNGEKMITMADMVRHAQMHVNDREEVSWTIWFLTNYIEPDATWVNKDGQAWSMEKLVTIQTNAQLFNATNQLAPCGGTHGLFALACACNSYQQKHGKLQGAWIAARQKLDNHIALAQRGQNRDGSFSTEFFKTNGYSPEMGKRFKSSGHMLEWLMMALPPERLEEQWVKSAVMNVANDLVRWGNVGLGTADTGAMYHALHSLVLYRNRMEPSGNAIPPVPATVLQPEKVAQLPPEMKNPVPGSPMPTTPAPLDKDKATDPKAIPAPTEPEATIRLLNPATNKLSPLGNARPLLRPITNSTKPEAPPKPGDTPAPPPIAEKIEEPTRLPLSMPAKPVLEKPAPSEKPTPAPSEPKSEPATVKPLAKDEGGTSPVPLFGEEPGEMPAKPAAPDAPAVPSVEGAKAPPVAPAVEKPPVEVKPTDAKTPAPGSAPPSLVPTLPEPTPAKSPSSSD